MKNYVCLIAILLLSPALAKFSLEHSQSIITTVNELRRWRGLPPCKLVPELSAVAQLVAQEHAKINRIADSPVVNSVLDSYLGNHNVYSYTSQRYKAKVNKTPQNPYKNS
jgi:hypothetical protein